MHAGCVFESCVIVPVFQITCAYWKVDDCVVFGVFQQFQEDEVAPKLFVSSACQAVGRSHPGRYHSRREVGQRAIVEQFCF